MIGPPTAEGLVPGDIKSLRWLIVKVTYSLMKLEKSQGELPIGDPLRLKLHDLLKLLIDFEFHIALDVDIASIYRFSLHF